MFCPKCGKEIPNEAKFCEFCGAPMEVAAQPAQPMQEPVYYQPAQEPVQQPVQPMQEPTYYQALAQDPYAQQTYQSQGQPNYYGAPVQQPAPSKDRVAAGLLGIFLGSLGIHKFYLGYKKPALIMLLVSLLTFGIGACVMEIIGLIEGIMYLTKSDEEFQQTYVQNEKDWF